MSKKKVKSEDKEKEVEINIESEQVVADSEIKQTEPEQIKENKAEDFEQKFNELNDKYLRLSAEFDNFRRRNLKERMELIKTAGEDILINILPVMDNFERALKAIENNNSENTEAIKEGVMLIYTRFKEFLLQKGVKEIEATGLEFNTDLHEALTKIPAPTTDLKGKVIDVVEKGYLMHEKVIRFAKVVVGE
ncbi:MAG: nucleotide exchange factor GrpE [Bacteroidales bacterium]